MISKDVEYWLKIIKNRDFETNVANRDLFIWGAYSKGLIVKNALEDCGFNVRGFIDSYKNEYQGSCVYHPEDIKKILPKPFVFVAIECLRDTIVDFLKGNGFAEGMDYIYFTENIPEIIVEGLRGKYEDAYDNVFLSKGSSLLQNIRIICKGSNNYVSIGKNFRAIEGCEGKVTIHLSYGSSVSIGNNFHFKGNLEINADFGGTVNIGDAFQCYNDGIIFANNDGKVNIGKKVSTGSRLFILGGKVDIGDDCMFSHDVSIIGTNAHSIFDLHNESSINKVNEKPIKIENHVWLGKSATVLYGSKVGENSIIGASSLVKGVYTDNSIIAGNIARVLRTNCTWDRRADIEFCEL